MSGIHVGYVFDTGLFYIFCGHCPAIGDAAMHSTVASAAERDEVIGLVVAAFAARDDVVDLQILRGIAERASVAVSAVDGFAERGIDGS